MHTVKRYPWQRKRLRLLLLLLIPAALFAVYAVNRSQTAQAVRDRIAALEAAGAPISLEAVQEALPEPAPETNAAIPIVEAAKRLKPLPWEELNGLEIFADQVEQLATPYPVELRDRLHQVALDNWESIELLREASARPASHYSLVRDGHRLVLPPEVNLWDAAALEAVHATVAAEFGDGNHAAQSLLSVLQVAESLRDAPSVYLQQQRFDILRLFKRTLERVLNRTEMLPVYLTQLLEAVRKVQLVPGMERALIGYRAAVVGWLPEFSGSAFMQFSGVLDRNVLVYLDMMDRGLAALEQQPREGWESWERVLNQFNRRGPFLGFDDQRVVHRLFEEWPLVAAQQALILGALGVELHLAAAGAFPGALHALSPQPLAEVPVDPYSHTAIQYLQMQGGYTVFSVGPPAPKEQGPGRRTRSPNPGDVVIKVQRLAPPPVPVVEEPPAATEAAGAETPVAAELPAEAAAAEGPADRRQ